MKSESDIDDKAFVAWWESYRKRDMGAVFAPIAPKKPYRPKRQISRRLHEMGCMLAVLLLIVMMSLFGVWEEIDKAEQESWEQ